MAQGERHRIVVIIFELAMLPGIFPGGSGLLKRKVDGRANGYRGIREFGA
jgi:hypothetical protein